MMHPPDGRSPVAVALGWSSRIMSVSLEMVVPGLIGNWLDGRFQTSPWIMVIAFAAGGAVAILHLIQMTKPSGNRGPARQAEEQEKSDR
ncbi:MAG: AtpZ/AtpI family protein [Planctomycetales bacterium]|nr:AtpZ/AtpI family protein [Planctomycetales bacterium]